jgi:hypothetical protein
MVASCRSRDARVTTALRVQPSLTEARPRTAAAVKEVQHDDQDRDPTEARSGRTRDGPVRFCRTRRAGGDGWLDARLGKPAGGAAPESWIPSGPAAPAHGNGLLSSRDRVVNSASSTAHARFRARDRPDLLDFLSRRHRLVNPRGSNGDDRFPITDGTPSDGGATRDTGPSLCHRRAYRLGCGDRRHLGSGSARGG